jgi:hypothetical protein
MGSDSRKYTDSHKSFWNHVVPQISTDSPPKLPALPLFTNVMLRFFYFPSVLFLPAHPDSRLLPVLPIGASPAAGPGSPPAATAPGSAPAAAPGSSPDAAPGSPLAAAPGSPPWRARVAAP